MPRFFFDILDGEITRDVEGAEMPGVGDAQVHAADLAGRLLSQAAPRFWSMGELVVIVRDEDDCALLAISCMGVDASTVLRAAPKPN